MRKVGTFWKSVIQYCMPIINTQRHIYDKRFLIDQKKFIRQKIYSQKKFNFNNKKSNENSNKSIYNGDYNINFLIGLGKKNNSQPMLYTSKYLIEMKKKNTNEIMKNNKPKKIFLERLGGNYYDDEN